MWLALKMDVLDEVFLYLYHISQLPVLIIHCKYKSKKVRHHLHSYMSRRHLFLSRYLCRYQPDMCRDTVKCFVEIYQKDICLAFTIDITLLFKEINHFLIKFGPNLKWLIFYKETEVISYQPSSRSQWPPGLSCSIFTWSISTGTTLEYIQLPYCF